MTTKEPAEPQTTPQAKKIWKRWKWIGLALYAATLLFNRWLPGPVVMIAYLYGIVVIPSLLFLLFRYLKNRLFRRVRNRLIGAFVFVGFIPLVLLAGVIVVERIRAWQGDLPQHDDITRIGAKAG